MVRKLLIAASVVLNIGLLGFLGLMWFAMSLRKSHLVAVIPGPDGRPASLEIWYAQNGDLRIVGKHLPNTPELERRDYYSTAPIMSATWKSDRHVIVHLADGGGWEVQFGPAEVGSIRPHLDGDEVKSLLAAAPVSESR